MSRTVTTAQGLPRRVYIDKWGTYFYRARRGGVAIFRPLGKERHIAIEDAKEMDASFFGIGSRVIPEATIRVLLARSKGGAKTRNIQHSLTMADLRSMADRAAGRCEVSGLSFDLSNVGARQRRPWAPSIDRIVSQHGYVADNCRLVCVAVNLAMNEWGVAALKRIAVGVLQGKAAHAVPCNR